MAGMTLIVVRCPSCGNPLTPGDDDLVIACAQCGAGLHLADEGPQPDRDSVCPDESCQSQHVASVVDFQGQRQLDQARNAGRQSQRGGAPVLGAAARDERAGLGTRRSRRSSRRAFRCCSNRPC